MEHCVKMYYIIYMEVVPEGMFDSGRAKVDCRLCWKSHRQDLIKTQQVTLHGRSPWLRKKPLQLLFVCSTAVFLCLQAVCHNSYKFELQLQYQPHIIQDIKYCMITFLYIFNSLSTSPNSLDCTRALFWKHQSSSCCLGAASSQLRPVDFQVSAV